MPVRLLAALLLGLLSLLPVGCAQQHLDSHSPRTPGVATAGPPSGSSERHCAAGESAAPADRSPRSVASCAARAPSCPAAPGAGSADAPADRPAPAARAAGTPGPRGPLLVTGRWRI